MKLQSDYPVRLLCALLGLPLSSWYYKTVERDEADLRQAAERVVGRFRPTARSVSHIRYGVRRPNSTPSAGSRGDASFVKWI
jgi:hypothetical protein